MKFLILAMALAISLKVSAGTDQGGGGHLIIDKNGNLVALDLYNGQVISQSFSLKDVCPVGLTQVEISKDKDLAEIYKSALTKFNILKKDNGYRLAEANIQESIQSIQWYNCEGNLPNIFDHRFNQGLLNNELLQIALQTQKGEVVFSNPVLKRALSTDNGRKSIEATIIHEIALKAWGRQTPRDNLSWLVSGFVDQNPNNLRLLYNEKDFVNVHLTSKVNSRVEDPTSFTADIYFENGNKDTFVASRGFQNHSRGLQIAKNGKYLITRNLFGEKSQPESYIKERLEVYSGEPSTQFIFEYKISFDNKISKICFRDITYSPKLTYYISSNISTEGMLVLKKRKIPIQRVDLNLRAYNDSGYGKLDNLATQNNASFVQVDKHTIIVSPICFNVDSVL